MVGWMEGIGRRRWRNGWRGMGAVVAVDEERRRRGYIISEE